MYSYVCMHVVCLCVWRVFLCMRVYVCAHVRTHTYTCAHTGVPSRLAFARSCLTHVQPHVFSLSLSNFPSHTHRHTHRNLHINIHKNMHTSAAMGTVELTGLEMMQRIALGHASAQAATRLRTMEPLVLNRSSLVQRRKNLSGQCPSIFTA